MKKIAVLFGGVSFEHEISIVSAIAMKKVLKQKFDFIFLDKNREFYLMEYDSIKSKLFSSSEYLKSPKITLVNGGFSKKKLFGEEKLQYDVVLNLIHGADGEDGTIASLMKFYGINFIGPRTEASVVSFNKYLTKSYAKECGVPVVSYKYFSKNDKVFVESFPVIIKPVRLGSSIGVSIVKNQDELDYALDVAFEFDDEIIIEPFIQNVKEYNLAGMKIQNEFVFSKIEEPQKEEFLDFDKKYLDFNRTQSIQEVNLSSELVVQLQDSFSKIYNDYFNGSIIRCDFFLIDDTVYLNEINPIPGSMANYLFDDFHSYFISLGQNLPMEKQIMINYEYVNKIHSAKGKL
jgi:D-alanine-D-alanine ligase